MRGGGRMDMRGLAGGWVCVREWACVRGGWVSGRVCMREWAGRCALLCMRSGQMDVRVCVGGQVCVRA